MPWFKKKRSPIDQRIEELNQELASLEAEQRRQAEETERRKAAASAATPAPGQENGQEQPGERPALPFRETRKPRIRTTVNPGGTASVHGIEPHEFDFFARRDRPVDFSEPGHVAGAKPKDDKKPVGPHGTHAGPGLWEALLSLFNAPKPRQEQEKFASFLTTGSFQRLKPLKYERRIARNRFIAVAVIVLAIAFLLVKCIR
jgi:hypothetical protein